MQRFYGLNLDYLGVEYSIEHAAACAACIPSHGALFASKYPEYSIRLSELPVKVIADVLSKNENQEEIEMEPVSMNDFNAWLNGEFVDEGVKSWH